MPVDLKKSQPFEVVSEDYGGSRRELLRYTCVCETPYDIPITSGHPISTDEHRKVLGRRGVVLTTRGKIVACPECRRRSAEAREAKRAARNQLESEIMPDVPLPPPLALPSPSLSAVAVPNAASIAAQAWINKPSPDQRIAIRSALDRHFDDEKGMYLASATDQSLADELRVPRAWVETIRETAYGPIRVTPEIQALRSDIEAAQTMLDDLKARLAKLAG